MVLGSSTREYRARCHILFPNGSQGSISATSRILLERPVCAEADSGSMKLSDDLQPDKGTQLIRLSASFDPKEGQTILQL